MVVRHTHQPACLASSIHAAAAASPAVVNRAKQVAPDPDMRARRAPGAKRNAASTSAITGRQAMAAGVRSLPRCASQSMSASGSRGTSALSSRLSKRSPNLANTSRVAKAATSARPSHASCTPATRGRPARRRLFQARPPSSAHRRCSVHWRAKAGATPPPRRPNRRPGPPPPEYSSQAGNAPPLIHRRAARAPPPT